MFIRYVVSLGFGVAVCGNVSRDYYTPRVIQ